MTTMRYPRSLNRCRNRGLPYLTGVGTDKGVMVIIPFPLSTDQRFNQLVANLEAVNLYISTFIAQYLNMDIGLRMHHESVVSHLTVVLDTELSQLRDSLDDECEYDQMFQVLIEDEYYTGNWLKMARTMAELFGIYYINLFLPQVSLEGEMDHVLDLIDENTAYFTISEKRNLKLLFGV